MTRERHVDRLLELCGEAGTADAWKAALRAGRSQIAVANDGQAMTIEVVLRGLCRVRVGVTPTGRVIHPGDDPADIVIDGPAREVAGFLLGRNSVAEAQESGLMVVGEDVRVDRLEPLRGVVADRLHEMLAGRTAMAPLGALLAWRARRVVEFPAEVAAVALAKAAPAFVAVAGLLTGPAPATARVVAVEGPPIMADAAPAAPAVPHLSPKAVPAHPLKERLQGDVERNAAPALPRPVSVSAGIGRTDEGGYGVDVSQDDPTGSASAWGMIRCDNWYRSALCDTADRLPPTGL